MGHVALRLNNNIVIIGGLNRDSSDKSLRILVPMHEIFMYNLYTEQWRNLKPHIPGNKVPAPRCQARAAVIGKDVYMFGGNPTLGNHYFNDLWKLTSITKGGFTWCEIEFQCDVKLPSPRKDHSAWEYEDCMWVFGGEVDFDHDQSEYLNDHGEFSDGFTNQLLCYDPSTQLWTNPQSFGTIPSPRRNHSTALIGDKVWLLRGCGGRHGSRIEENFFFQLDMKSMTWTHTLTNNTIPVPQRFSSLVAVSNTQLVVYGITKFDIGEGSDTWIIDLPSSTWRKYTSKDEHRWAETCSAGVNKCAVIIGGAYAPKNSGLQQTSRLIFEVMLEPKSLQQLAMKMIYSEQDKLPWTCLPPKLTAQLDLVP